MAYRGNFGPPGGPPFRGPFNPMYPYPHPRDPYGGARGRPPFMPVPVDRARDSPQISTLVPYCQQPDTRLPPPSEHPSDKPSYLVTDGYETHSLIFLSPKSPLLSNLLDLARAQRAPTMDTYPEDLVERALDRKTLCHISDGPTGGIWVVSAGKEEIVSCLVLEMRGGWEVLGIGKDLSEGDIFLRHPCGFGPDTDDQAKQKGKDKRDKGKAKVDPRDVVNSKAWIKARKKEVKNREKAAENEFLRQRGIDDPLSKTILFGLKLIGLGGSGDNTGSS